MTINATWEASAGSIPAASSCPLIVAWVALPVRTSGTSSRIRFASRWDATTARKPAAVARWRIKGPAREGAVARWYAKVRSSGSQIEEYRKQAAQLTEGLPAGAKVLEVAPGPGYLAVEIARLGFQVTGLDISHTFIQIGSENARQAGVSVDFRQGDAAVMPFEADSFDLIVCQAAFKNFIHPASALDEMYL